MCQEKRNQGLQWIMSWVSVCSSHKPFIWLATWHFFLSFWSLIAPSPHLNSCNKIILQKHMSDHQFLLSGIIQHPTRNMDVKREGTRKWLSWKTSQVTNNLRVVTHKQVIKSSRLLWPLRQRVCVSALISPASRVTLPWYKQTWIWHPACQKLDFARWWLRVDAQRETYSPLGCHHDLLETHTHSCCSSSVDWYLHTVLLDHPPSSTSFCLLSHISPTHISPLKCPIFLVKTKQWESIPIKFPILWPRYYLAVAINV